MSRKVYDIQGRVSAADYAALLRGLAPFATSFGLIVRSHAVKLADTALSVMQSLEPLLMSVQEVTKWPGTELIGGRRSSLYLYRLVPDSLDILIESASGLFQWVNPGLPEDLHLLRKDGATVLGTIAQEGDAWMELDDQEAEQWLAEAPATLREAINDHTGN